MGACTHKITEQAPKGRRNVNARHPGETPSLPFDLNTCPLLLPFLFVFPLPSLLSLISTSFLPLASPRGTWLPSAPLIAHLSEYISGNFYLLFFKNCHT